MTATETVQQLLRDGFILVFNQDKLDVVKTAEALQAAGFSNMEVTCRISQPLAKIEQVRQALPDFAVGAASLIDNPAVLETYNAAHADDPLPNIEQVVQCDIDQRVTEVCERYFDWVTPARSDPRAQVLFDDGVAYIEHQRASFNLIIVDSTDPIGPGIGLFLHDFYDKVARALAPGGVMVAQTESPHWSAPMVGAIYSELKQSFAQVAPYCGAVPTYPSGFWTWAWASNDTRPDAHFDAQRARQLEPGCSYYNADIHRAAFALPTFARQAVAGHNPFSRFQNAPEE